MKKLTVFTPTYNRAFCLHNVYNSLCKQTSKDFEWLIVDDGSNDKTEELVNSWIESKKLNITYYKTINGGKSRAHNFAVNKCETELFFCVDSDDYIANDAVEKICNIWSQAKNDDTIAGIISLKSNENEEAQENSFPKGIRSCSIFDLYEEYGFRSETALIFATEILKRYLFPVFDDEKFVGESVIYNEISKKYKMYILNVVTYYFKYYEDGYSNDFSKLLANNPKGYMYFLSRKIAMKKNMLWKTKAVLRYIIWGITHNQKEIIRNSEHRIFCIMVFPMALLIMVIKCFRKQK